MRVACVPWEQTEILSTHACSRLGGPVPDVLGAE